MKKLTAVLAVACAAIGTATTASAGVSFGVSDDAGKYASDGGYSFLSMLNDVGLTENRVTVRWDATQPTTIVDRPFLNKYVPRALSRGVRVVFAVYPDRAKGVTGTPGGQQQFVDFLQIVARTYPQVTAFIVGNEPNQPRFWQPQFGADGAGAAGAAYESLLAQSYDALKAVNPNIDVIGLGLSPRGSNVSTSPVRFIRDMGQAYRTSARNAPIMDEMAFHPYPNQPTDGLNSGYQWPNAGFANLDRIKQAVWDAFHGTAQPVFQESGPTASSLFASLKLRLDEVGWQVAIPAANAGAYSGAENVKVTDEATQAQIYSDLVKEAACDADLSGVSFFGFVDESDLARFQAGFVRADGTHRASYDSVKSTLAQTGGSCAGAAVDWKHTTHVIGAKASWGKLRRKPAFENYWSFLAKATENATFKAGVFRVKGPKGGSSKDAQRALLSVSSPQVALSAQGNVKAYITRLVKFPTRRLKPGWYAYAIRISAEMNPDRSSFFMSKPFRVGKAKQS
jgi:hypothetical protein